MEPTFIMRDIVLVDSLSLYIFPPERGELIVYKDPRQVDRPFVIKRIVGMPGEDLDIKDDIVSVTGSDGLTTYFGKGSLLGRENNGKDWHIHLGPEDYLLMGDNRAGSKDGRTTGTIQKSEMFGRPYFRIFPLLRIGLIE
jgi:signal peptidase I